MGERPGPSALPTTAELCAYVWFHIESHPDRRPTLADLAHSIGIGPRQLRRRWAQTGRPPLRDLISYSRLAYVQHLVADDGWKALAAVWRAGYRSPWNVNRQSKRYTGRTIGQWRDRMPLQLDRKEVLRKLEKLRTASSGRRT